MKRIVISVVLIVIIVFTNSGCSAPKRTFPVSIYPKEVLSIPEPDAKMAGVPAEYQVEVFMKDLIWPTSIEFDTNGNTYVAESGYVYGDPFAPAQVLRITQTGDITRYASGFMGPVTDLLWHKNRLYVSHRGKISVVESMEKLAIWLPISRVMAIISIMKSVLDPMGSYTLAREPQLTQE